MPFLANWWEHCRDDTCYCYGRVASIDLKIKKKLAHVIERDTLHKNCCKYKS